MRRRRRDTCATLRSARPRGHRPVRTHPSTPHIRRVYSRAGKTPRPGCGPQIYRLAGIRRAFRSAGRACRNGRRRSWSAPKGNRRPWRRSPESGCRETEIPGGIAVPQIQSVAAARPDIPVGILRQRQNRTVRQPVAVGNAADILRECTPGDRDREEGIRI